MLVDVLRKMSNTNRMSIFSPSFMLGESERHSALSSNQGTTAVPTQTCLLGAASMGTYIQFLGKDVHGLNNITQNPLPLFWQDRKKQKYATVL